MIYHGRTSELLRRPLPMGSDEVIAAVEKRLGILLPESVKEWYTTLNGTLILSKYSNSDHAFDPEKFELVVVGDRQLVKFLSENQGVCWWGFDPSLGEDPPVFVNVDPPPDKLFVYARSFSEFTYVRVFDFERAFEEGRFQIECRGVLTPEALRWLETNFGHEPSSYGYPSEITRRFSSHLGRVVIWQANDGADWILSSPNAADLAQLSAQVSEVW